MPSNQEKVSPDAKAKKAVNSVDGKKLTRYMDMKLIRWKLIILCL
ncbi:MAG: hypothetical protein OGM18_10250 [Oscillospiraceae bacterium]|nr:MAG: hypothetical protein OGM18_10250 [Oscillospiraceae bacterium]